MRIYLSLNKSNETIPFNYQSYLTGAIHKWIGRTNDLHDKPSLYCFSWLQNVNMSTKGIQTKHGSYFFIGAHHEKLIKLIIQGIMNDSFLCYGVHVNEVRIVAEPEFRNKEVFYSASPVFVKRRFEDKEKHIAFNDPEANTYLTETLQTKLGMADLSEDGVKVYFKKDYSYSKTKIVSYKGIGNKVNICPIIIEGTQEQISFAWNVGVGNSTGIGFGALK